MKVGVNLCAVRPGVKYVARVTHAMPIQLSRATIRTFLPAYVNFNLHYYPITTPCRLSRFAVFEHSNVLVLLSWLLAMVVKPPFT